MKAVVYDRYGTPDVLRIEDVPKPTPKPDEILVKVHASSVNFADYAWVGGNPFILRLMTGALFRPKHKTLGIDIAGVVESVGSQVSRLKSGDEIYGDIGDYGLGGYAEYVAAPEKACAIKPSNLSFSEAAAMPQSSIVALQGLKDGGIEPRYHVLINGASGGIGTFAVQIAKALGAEVTGVCSTSNIELVKELGADHVIDYMKDDFTKMGVQYDLIFDVPVKHSITEVFSALKPNRKYMAIGFSWGQVLSNPSPAKSEGRTKSILDHKPCYQDLVYMRRLVESGKVKPVIDTVYSMNRISDAVKHYATRHASGKIVVSMVDY